MSPRTANLHPAKCRSCRADRATAPQRRWACRGLCGTCYRRWANQGFPGNGPVAAGRSPRPDKLHREARLATYRELVAQGVSTADICQRLGVTRRSLTRYAAVTNAA